MIDKSELFYRLGMFLVTVVILIIGCAVGNPQASLLWILGIVVGMAFQKHLNNLFFEKLQKRMLKMHNSLDRLIEIAEEKES